MPRPGNLLILGDLQQIGQGHRTLWLITLELFDRLASISEKKSTLWLTNGQKRPPLENSWLRACFG